MECIVLSLGTNEGDRELNLERARALLERSGVKILASSVIYETEPVGTADQQYFLNQVLTVKSRRSPMRLLELCQQLEKKMGRLKSFKNAPRIIDIDILFYKNVITEDVKLTLPHPLLQERNFILEPLAEILPDQRHPLLAMTMAQLLDDCEDEHIVRPSRGAQNPKF